MKAGAIDDTIDKEANLLGRRKQILCWSRYSSMTLQRKRIWVGDRVSMLCVAKIYMQRSLSASTRSVRREKIKRD